MLIKEEGNKDVCNLHKRESFPLLRKKKELI